MSGSQGRTTILHHSELKFYLTGQVWPCSSLCELMVTREMISGQNEQELI
jgi:hypothetical protein